MPTLIRRTALLAGSLGAGSLSASILAQVRRPQIPDGLVVLTFYDAPATWTELHVQGGAHFSGTLAQPTTDLGYYRDIAVLAFPTPPAASVRMANRNPNQLMAPPNGP